MTCKFVRWALEPPLRNGALRRLSPAAGRGGGSFRGPPLSLPRRPQSRCGGDDRRATWHEWDKARIPSSFQQAGDQASSAQAAAHLQHRLPEQRGLGGRSAADPRARIAADVALLRARDQHGRGGATEGQQRGRPLASPRPLKNEVRQVMGSPRTVGENVPMPNRVRKQAENHALGSPRSESNRRPHSYQECALPTELRGHGTL
jgi:hypothetical protein